MRIASSVIATVMTGAPLAERALTLNFYYSFNNVIGNVVGTVSGEIFGLTDNATSSATNITIASYPSALTRRRRPRTTETVLVVLVIMTRLLAPGVDGGVRAIQRVAF